MRVVNATPRPLYPRETDRLSIVWENGWAPGTVWTGTENFAPTGIRSPDRPARSELLYRLSYPGPIMYTINPINAQWLRCCATNRKVAGSIPDGVIGIFH